MGIHDDAASPAAVVVGLDQGGARSKKELLSANSLESFDEPVHASTPAPRGRLTKAAIVIVGMVLLAGAVVAVMFVSENRPSINFPEKFTAKYTMYNKYPDGTRGDAVSNGTLYHVRATDTMAGLATQIVADGSQRMEITALGDKAAYQLYRTATVMQGEEGDFPEKDGDPIETKCIEQSHLPTMSEIHEGLNDPVKVSEDEMVQAVGPGACSGDVTRYLVTAHDISVVVCMVSPFEYEAVTSEYVGRASLSTSVDIAFVNTIALPKTQSGDDLNCGPIDVTRRLNTAHSRRLSLDCYDTQDFPAAEACSSNAEYSDCVGTYGAFTVGDGAFCCSSGGVQACDAVNGGLVCGFKWLLNCAFDLRRLDEHRPVPEAIAAPEPAPLAVPAVPAPTGLRQLKKKKKRKDRTKYVCKTKDRTKARHCVFMHGAGVPDVEHEGPTMRDSFPWYWGPVQHYVKDSCLSVKFLHLPTAEYAWNSEYIGQQFCSLAKGPGGHATDIDNTIVFAHGSGNLIMANALKQGYCGLSDNSHWLEVQDGLPLSRMAKWAQEFCSEADADPEGDSLDDQLDSAADELKKHNNDGLWLGSGSKKDWNKFKGEWRKRVGKSTWQKLLERQARRRLVRETGICRIVDETSRKFGLAPYTFEQNQCWKSLSVERNATKEAMTSGKSFNFINGRRRHDIAQLVKSRVTGSMCAAKPSNARSRASYYNIKPSAWSYEFESYDTQWSRCWSKDDDVVDKFQEKPSEDHYAAPTSFYETTCRYGNTDDKKNRPCDWFHEMSCKYAMTAGSGTSANSRPWEVISITDDDFVDDSQFEDQGGIQ